MSRPDVYLLYRMNAFTGTILSREEIEAYCDDAAITKALAQAGTKRIELWHDQRKIFAVSGSGAPAELSFA